MQLFMAIFLFSLLSFIYPIDGFRGGYGRPLYVKQVTNKHDSMEKERLKENDQSDDQRVFSMPVSFGIPLEMFETLHKAARIHRRNDASNGLSDMDEGSSPSNIHRFAAFGSKGMRSSMMMGKRRK